MLVVFVLLLPLLWWSQQSVVAHSVSAFVAWPRRTTTGRRPYAHRRRPYYLPHPRTRNLSFIPLLNHQRSKQQKRLQQQLSSRSDDGIRPQDEPLIAANGEMESLHIPSVSGTSHTEESSRRTAAITPFDSTSTNNNSNDFWIQIGSTITTDACPLLGIKSLGVDYGLVRTGLAMSVGYEPIPLAIITASNNTTELCQTIIQYAVTYQVQQIVVGLPLHKNGTIAEQTKLTLNFTQQLAIHALSQLGPQVSILLFDERYTSKMAVAREQAKNPKLIPTQSLYGTLDATAAGIILENYYDDNGIGAHAVALPERIRDACIQQYHGRQSRIKEEQQARMQNEMEKRQRRLDLIEEAKRIDRQQQLLLNTDGSTTTSNDSSSTGKKRKKKKKK